LANSFGEFDVSQLKEIGAAFACLRGISKMAAGNYFFFQYFVAIYISYHLQTFMFSKAMTKKELQRAPHQPQSRK